MKGGDHMTSKQQEEIFWTPPVLKKGEIGVETQAGTDSDADGGGLS
jgi:hypothetical protein